MNLNQWAIKWGVPFAAVEDLRREMGAINTDPLPVNGDSESAVQAMVRLEASKKGLRLWRNNVGAAYMQDGGFLRYGLCNDSKRMNDMIKSSDLIGIRPVTITSDMVGRVFGQFVAREVKEQSWRYTATAREQSQLRFIELINAYGGDAAFANCEGSL